MPRDLPSLTILLNDADPSRAAKVLPLIYDQLRAAASLIDPPKK